MHSVACSYHSRVIISRHIDSDTAWWLAQEPSNIPRKLHKYQQQARSQTFLCVWEGGQIGQILGPFFDYAWIILRSLDLAIWGGGGGGGSQMTPLTPPGYGPE